MLRFVINLDCSIDRWNAIEKRLNSLNITAKRISAVDGRKKSDTEIESILYPMDYEYFLWATGNDTYDVLRQQGIIPSSPQKFLIIHRIHLYEVFF